MSETSYFSCRAAATEARFPLYRKWFSCLVLGALLLSLWPVHAEGPDDAYMVVFNLITQADDLNAGGKAVPALAKFKEAQKALLKLEQEYPGWNATAVTYRRNYLIKEIAALTEKTTKPAAPAATAQETKPETSAAATSESGGMKLLEPGAEPRKALRLHPKADDKQVCEMSLKIGVETKMGAMQTPAVKLPTIKLALETTVKSISPEGDITYNVTFTDASVAEEAGAMPQVVEMMKGAFGAIKGMSGTGTISSCGQTKSMETKAPSSADAQTRQMVDQMKESFSKITLQLPEGPVGVGARWEISRSLKEQGMAIKETETYTLESIQDDQITLKITSVQSAANQKIENPAMPGMKVDLTKFTGKGSGNVTWDLTRILPLDGKQQGQVESTMGMNMGGQKQTISQKRDTVIQMQTK